MTMTTFDHDGPSVVISAVMFGEDEINIQYMEPRENTRAAFMGRSVTVKVDYIEEEVEALQELLEDIIDKGSLLIRNPPKRMRRKSESGGREVLLELIADDDEFESDDD